jgi:hypothetical protein
MVQKVNACGAKPKSSRPPFERLTAELLEAKALASYQVAVEWRDKCKLAEKKQGKLMTVCKEQPQTMTTIELLTQADLGIWHKSACELVTLAIKEITKQSAVHQAEITRLRTMLKTVNKKLYGYVDTVSECPTCELKKMLCKELYPVEKETT